MENFQYKPKEHQILPMAWLLSQKRIEKMGSLQTDPK